MIVLTKGTLVPTHLEEKISIPKCFVSRWTCVSFDCGMPIYNGVFNRHLLLSNNKLMAFAMMEFKTIKTCIIKVNERLRFHDQCLKK